MLFFYLLLLYKFGCQYIVYEEKSFLFKHVMIANKKRIIFQESGRYKSLIRQHMDLQAVQARLDKGFYSDCIHKFFRDLLLVFNNAIVFFRKTSPEHIAAQEIRVQVSKEMKLNKLGKPRPTTLKMQPKREEDSFAKSNKSSIITECRKRSSNKAVSQGKKEREVEEKPKANEKKIDASLVKVEDKGVRMKRTQERVGRRGGSRSTSTKGGETKHEYGGNELSSHDALEGMVEKKENAKKKQGVESFLKRMKQNSPKDKVEEENDDEDDADDIVSEEESKDSKLMEKEKKRKGRKRSEGRREERVTRSSSGGRGSGVRDQIGKGKRGVGRPPKRHDSVAAASGRRGRDQNNGDSEVGIGVRSRKRLRR